MREILIAAFALAAMCRAQETVPCPVEPEWQIAAGGKLAFDVASVRPIASGSYASAGFPAGRGQWVSLYRRALFSGIPPVCLYRVRLQADAHFGPIARAARDPP